MSQPAIEIKNLSKKYRIDHYGKNKQNTIWDVIGNAIKKPSGFITGDRAEHEAFWALKDVNLTVNHGDVVGIIGKNGSGKSTMLKVLSRIVEPTTGTMKMQGRVASLLEVGTGFHPELTGRENVFFNGSILGMSRREINSKFNDIIEFSEVEQFLDTPVKFYSSGMYVKLAFAVAAHLDPDILIVDEVLSVGDAAFQKKSLGKMKDVAGQGRTVLFVSHNAGSIKQLCNRAVLLGKGQVQFTGSTDEVLTQYTNSTQETINDKVINLDDGSISNIRVNDSAAKLTNLEGGTKKLAIQFEFEGLKDKNNTVFGIGLRSVTDGSLVIFTHNHLEAVDFVLNKGKSGISAELSLPSSLSPGEYTLELNCWNNGEFILDSHAISNIIIDPYAPFSNGEVFANYTSLLAAPSKWKKL